MSDDNERKWIHPKTLVALSDYDSLIRYEGSRPLLTPRARAVLEAVEGAMERYDPSSTESSIVRLDQFIEAFEANHLTAMHDYATLKRALKRLERIRKALEENK